MSRRPATVTQADIHRSIRAVKAAGLRVFRLVVRTDGVAIETEDMPAPMATVEAPAVGARPIPDL